MLCSILYRLTIADSFFWWLCLSFVLNPSFGQKGPDRRNWAVSSASAIGSHQGIVVESSGSGRAAGSNEKTDAVDLQPGVKVGLNFATFGGEEAETIETVLRGLSEVTGTEDGRRTGLVVEAFIMADFGGPIGLRPGMRYIQKGNQTAFNARTSGGQIESGTVTIKVDYVEVPILLRGEFPRIGPVLPHVLVGPTFGFSVNTGARIRLGGRSEPVNIGEDFGGNAVSLEFGAGGNVEVGALTATTDVRFGFGLTEVPGVLFSARYRGVTATVGVIF